MSVLTTTSARSIVDAYIQALTTGGAFEQYLTDDVTIELVGTDLSANGRDDVAAFIRFAHAGAFDSTVEFRAVIVDGDTGQGACEIVFRARHIAEFAGIPATGREVEVPYSVHYDITDDGISALRIYALGQGLVSALTA